MEKFCKDVHEWQTGQHKSVCLSSQVVQKGETALEERQYGPTHTEGIFLPILQMTARNPSVNGHRKKNGIIFLNLTLMSATNWNKLWPHSREMCFKSGYGSFLQWSTRTYYWFVFWHFYCTVTSSAWTHVLECFRQCTVWLDLHCKP